MSKIVRKYQLKEEDVNRIVEMAWEDRTPFEAIKFQFGLSEGEVIKLMKQEMKLSSWKLWRARAQSKSQKHLKKRSNDIQRFKCKLQRTVTHNKISKR